MKKTLSRTQFSKWFMKSINSYLSTLPADERAKRIRAAHAAATEPEVSQDQTSLDIHDRDRNSRLTHNLAE